MLYLNYVKQNIRRFLCFTTHVKQNAITDEYPSNHVTHKTNNAFCFHQSEHIALSVICYLNQVKHCKTSPMFYLNYVKPNTTGVLCFTTYVKKMSFKSCATQNK